MIDEASSTPPKSKSSRYMWMIPIVLLVLAMLACDEVYVPPPMIDRVEVDDSVNGKAYITVVNVGLTYTNSNTPSSGETVAYESDDYGANWRHSEHIFAKSQTDRYAMEMYGEQLHFNGYSVWTFPRPVFRSVFYDDSGFPSTMRFELPQGKVANSGQGNVVYVAMGTQGVLVAKITANGLAPDWKLSSRGIDALTPLPISITQPGTILGIIVLILCVPPFALIHAYLLQRVWVYLLPAVEARVMALKVTAGLVILAIIGCVVWLTSDRIDLYEVLAVLTGITVLVGTVATVLLAQKAGVTDYTRNRLAVAAILVSLIVPGGAAAIFVMWWLVFGVVFCYWAYQRTYWRYVKQDELSAESRIQRWRVDRLAIEMVVVIAVGVVANVIQVGFLQALMYRVGGIASLISLLGIGLGVAGLYFLIRHYSRYRAKSILQLNSDAPAKRELRLMSRDLWMHTVYWIIFAVVLTGATFFGQMTAYGWFTSLLKTVPVQ